MNQVCTPLFESSWSIMLHLIMTVNFIYNSLTEYIFNIYQFSIFICATFFPVIDVLWKNNLMILIWLHQSSLSILQNPMSWLDCNKSIQKLDFIENLCCIMKAVCCLTFFPSKAGKVNDQVFMLSWYMYKVLQRI